MAIFVKGKTIVDQAEVKALSDHKVKPETKTIRFEGGKNIRDIVNQKLKEEVKTVEKIIVKKEIVEEPSRYHNIKEGDLHKLINKRSDYLNDMLDLKNNK